MASVRVVAGVVENARGQLLLAQRPRGAHLAGLWEFPGGKIEPGEDAHTALARELHEELGIVVHASVPLAGAVPVQVNEVTLEFRRVTQFSDAALAVAAASRSEATPKNQPLGASGVGLEGQALRWVAPLRVHRLCMPPADRPIAKLFGLAPQYVITPEPPVAGGSTRRAWLNALENSVKTCIAVPPAGGTATRGALVLLRAKHTPLAQLHAIAALARDIVAHHGGEILLQDDLELCQRWRFGGVSLTRAALLRTHKRRVPPELWLAASCHNAAELAHAHVIGCDFATLAPVLATATHPGAPHLGWAHAADMIATTPALPVYALGGLAASAFAQARAAGAVGIAGISGFWQG
jgi:8-oxo-dGTP diphosphatase